MMNKEFLKTLSDEQIEFLYNHVGLIHCEHFEREKQRRAKIKIFPIGTCFMFSKSVEGCTITKYLKILSVDKNESRYSVSVLRSESDFSIQQYTDDYFSIEDIEKLHYVVIDNSRFDKIEGIINEYTKKNSELFDKYHKLIIEETNKEIWESTPQ